ncbi:MAG: dihydrofolate reductase, partial [Ruminococcus sp.]
MNCIASVDNNWGIGLNNQLLYHIPEDLHYFKEKTIGKTVIMGKNTLLSLPNQKPLKDRTNIVLSKSISRDDLIVCRDLKSLLQEIKGYSDEDIFVIGGEQIYRLLLPYCNKAYITKVNGEKIADSFFENLDLNKEWTLTYVKEKQVYKGIEYCFCEYQK